MRTVAIVPYDDKWPQMFEAESLLTKEQLGGVAKGVHHIGSTSVPGLAAKPVINILLEVSDINKLDSYRSALVSISATGADCLITAGISPGSDSAVRLTCY